MNKNILTSLTIALVMLLTSCGKYEDGPFLSIRTKNARITGEWELVKSESTTTSSSGYSSTETFNGSIMTSSTTSSSGNYIDSYAYSSTWEIDGDNNSVVINTMADGVASSITTIWNWENGASEKEMLNIDGLLYRILRLTNKELVIESAYTSTSYSDNSKLTFEKK
jgi:hypothetical protein